MTGKNDVAASVASSDRALEQEAGEHQANVERIAKLCYEINRGIRAGLGETPYPPWDEAPEWHHATVRQGVEGILAGAITRPEESHNSWTREKLAHGWKYGPEKDESAKTHPQLVPFRELPIEQRLKDILFFMTVSALKTAPF
jgi:hypothetical protein